MAELNYKDWELDDIINWCQENNQVEWLKATAATTIERKVYPKVESVSKKGKKSWKQDKTQPYTLENAPITFVELKSEFIKTFIETTPKVKKPTMYDRIAAL